MINDLIKKFYISFIIFLSIFSIFFSTISDSKANVPDNNDDRLFFPINSTKFSSYYGYRDLNGKNNFHDGVDIPATPGTNIYACNNGVIINSNFLKGYGNCIIIQHDDGTKSLYGHLSENFIVSNGKYVKKGEHIGFVGPKYLSSGKLNGYTTGSHLHFTIFLSNGKTTNPLDFNFIEQK